LTKTTKLVLSGGNVVVSGSTTTGKTTATRQDVSETVPELEVKVMNNPSNTEFSAIVKGNNQQPVTMRVTDVNGRIIEVRNGISIGKAIGIGAAYKQGAYFVEFSQGSQRKVVKLIKL